MLRCICRSSCEQDAYATGMRAGCVEVRELRGCLWIRDVIHIDAGAGLCHLLRLVRDHQRVPGEAERVAADGGSLDLELGDDGRLFGVRHVEHAHAHRPGLVCEIQHALAAGILLDRQSLAALAKAVEVAAADDLHVGRLGHSRCVVGAGCRREQDQDGGSQADELCQHSWVIPLAADARVIRGAASPVRRSEDIRSRA